MPCTRTGIPLRSFPAGEGRVISMNILNESETIRRYCQERGYSEQVSKMNLDAQVCRWEKYVESLLGQKSSYSSYFYDFLNDMDSRRILSECLSLFPIEKTRQYYDRLVKADSLFKANTIQTKDCIWGKKNVRKYGYDEYEHWYYFRRPVLVDDSWEGIT
jgi:hypothetical protein